MRQTTLNQLTAAVNAVRTHFQKDLIQTRDYAAFCTDRPDVYAPSYGCPVFWENQACTKELDI